MKNIIVLVLTLLAITFIACSQKNEPINISKAAKIVVSSYQDGDAFTVGNLADGMVSKTEMWTSKEEESPWAKFDFNGPKQIGGIHVYFGNGASHIPKEIFVQYLSGHNWKDVPSAHITNNTSKAISIAFDATVEVQTSSLKIIFSKAPGNKVGVEEISIWEKYPEGIPELGIGVKDYIKKVEESDIPKIYINQSGYNLNKPKRFTTPTLEKGGFQIRNRSTNAIEFSGTIHDKIGDFTEFNPIGLDEYEIIAGSYTSFPFRIGYWWLERATYQNAIDFMVDSRHYVGNYKGKCVESYGWRDDTHFGWELHTLVPQYLSHPEAYKRMPSQIKYVAPNDPKLWGNLEPYREEAPDIIKLIHWGADVIVTQGLTHENLKAQLAYFLYAWPWMKEWLPQQNYEVVKSFTFENWAKDSADHKYAYDISPEHNLLALKVKMGTTKGELPPGRTVQPNLLLYEVALREGRKDTEDYFNAAYKQTQWMIENLDWEDPITTKGQRMSEFHTVTGMAHFATQYPERAPKSIKEKIMEWARVMIRRSDNMWDFRKLTDNAEWVPYDKSAPTKWNEPGNVVGFPACLLAAMQVIDDEGINRRLTELVYSHMDNCFGRNPCGRHFSYDGPREIEGVDVGWYSYYHGGIGMLADARFVLDGAPKYNHYPYHPEVGNVGWTEGWVDFNVAFNLSLAYMAYHDIELQVAPQKGSCKVILKAPYNFDYNVQENIMVDLQYASGKTGKLRLTELNPNSEYFEGELSTNEQATISYGLGYFAKKVVCVYQ